MSVVQYIASLGLLGFGGLIAFANAAVLVRQLLGKPSPSPVPFLGGIFLLLGALLFPGGLLRPWAVIGLFLDYGCAPYLIGVSIYLLQDARQHAPKNRLLSLAYEAKKCSGEFHLYPRHECIHEWRAKDGLSKGGMVMEASRFVPGELLELSLEDTRITFVVKEGRWELASETGWHDTRHSLAGARISEIAVP